MLAAKVESIVPVGACVGICVIPNCDLEMFPPHPSLSAHSLHQRPWPPWPPPADQHSQWLITTTSFAIATTIHLDLDVYHCHFLDRPRPNSSKDEHLPWGFDQLIQRWPFTLWSSTFQLVHVCIAVSNTGPLSINMQAWALQFQALQVSLGLSSAFGAFWRSPLLFQPSLLHLQCLVCPCTLSMCLHGIWSHPSSHSAEPLKWWDEAGSATRLQYEATNTDTSKGRESIQIQAGLLQTQR